MTIASKRLYKVTRIEPGTSFVANGRRVTIPLQEYIAWVDPMEIVAIHTTTQPDRCLLFLREQKEPWEVQGSVETLFKLLQSHDPANYRTVGN